MATIGQIISQGQANTENKFFTNMLQYAMPDSPVVPNKTELWNTYLLMKGGRLAAGDIEKFEQQYSAVKGAIYQKQLKSLDKLSLSGESDKSIRNKVKENPEMYQNLLDMVSDLKNSGTPEGMAMYAMAQNYLPQKTFADKMSQGEVSMGMRIGGPIAAGLGFGALQYATGRDVTEINKDIKSKTKELTTKRKDITKATTQTKPGLRKDIINLQDDIKDLKNKKINAPKRYQTLKGPKLGGAGTTAGALALGSAPAVSEYLGFGEEPGRYARNVGLLGLAGKTLMGMPAVGPWGVAGKMLGAGLLGIPAGVDLYRQYFGDEE